MLERNWISLATIKPDGAVEVIAGSLIQFQLRHPG